MFTIQLQPEFNSQLFSYYRHTPGEYLRELTIHALRSRCIFYFKLFTFYKFFCFQQKALKIAFIVIVLCRIIFDVFYLQSVISNQLKFLQIKGGSIEKMTDYSQFIAILLKSKQFLCSNIKTNKCILLIGPSKSGKSSLLRFFGGAGFTREDNQQGFPSLVDNSNFIPDFQPMRVHEESPFELSINKIQDPTDGEQIAVIQMPSIFGIVQQNNQMLAKRMLYKIGIWNFVLRAARIVHICLINPYQFITDDHKLIQFYSVWQKCVIGQQSSEIRDNIRSCLSIIFTKPEYQDDKQTLLTSLQHLSQAQNQQIGQNVTFSNAIEGERIYCFLGQDTQQNQGKQLFKSVLQNAQYYELYKNNLFVKDWGSTFLWNQLKQAQGQKIKQVLALLQKVNISIQNNQQAQNMVKKSLFLLFKCIMLSLIKSLKQGGLKQKQKQIQDFVKQTLKKQQIIKQEQMFKIVNTSLNYDQYFKLCLRIFQIINIGIKAQIFVEQFQNKFLVQIINTFKINDDIAKHIENWLSISFNLWNLSESFSKTCIIYGKESQAFQQNIHFTEDISKQIVKKICNISRLQVISAIASGDLLQKLSSIKNISQLAQYKQIVSMTEAGVQAEDQEQQQQQENNADSRIKRVYFKNDKYPDIYAQIKDKAKKIVIKTPSKTQQTNQRQYIKNLLASIQQQPQDRITNLQLLAKKLTQFKLIPQALQVYMQISNPIKLYQFLTQTYFKYVQNRYRKSVYQFIENKLIIYLQQKSRIYENLISFNDRAIQFRSCLHYCYDFMAYNLTSTAQQFCTLMEFSNQQLEGEVQNVQIQGNYQTLFNNSQTNTNQQMSFLNYVTFTKAEIINKIYDAQQKCKKNSAAFTQIKKYIDAVSISQKNK